ncbi:MAG: hypothetical protein NVS4B7_04790 [Ktedonobacteraceae bacterium]
MGEVYLANDEGLHRQVAIKVIRTDHAHHDDTDEAREAARLFLREAHTIAQLDHMHILPIHGSGEEMINGATLMYLVMPFRQEGSLNDWLHKRSKARVLFPQEVERIVGQAAAALQHAHNHGIIHQDVKPSNFLIQGKAKDASRLNIQLADFGVAKLMTTTSESQTVRGTPIYMAPEQWEGQPGPATDQYALAVMAYELLTGRPPFIGNNQQHLWHQHHHIAPLPPCALNPRLPKDLDTVLLRALSKNPKDRFRSMAAFAQAFQKALHNSGNIITIDPTEEIHARTQTATRLPTKAVTHVNNIVPLTPRRKKAFIGRALLQFSAVVALLVGSAGLFFFIRNAQETSSNLQATALSSTHTAASKTSIAAINVNTTATTQVEATNTSLSRASATTQAINAARTVTAQIQATTTAATATATIQAANAAATATAYATAIEMGNLALNDPLQDNTQGNNWDVATLPGGGGCAFTGKGYHAAILQTGDIAPCFAQPNFNNFSFQVQMTIISGDQGGIAFRADSNKGAFYYFHINRNGTYALETYNNYNSTAVISKGVSAAIKTDLNQTNTIAVIANGDTLDFYVNMQYITGLSDSTYTSGQIGVIAENTGNSTDVEFSDARVWSP